MILFQIFGNNPILILPWLCALLIGLTIHEFAHGLAANKYGDKTAEYAGRLTLNPLAHLDPMGTVMLLLFGFGWAKPVPIDINRIKERVGLVVVSIAGIVFNVVFAILSILTVKYLLLDLLPAGNLLLTFFGFLIYINLALAVFNLLPIPPLDGYHVIEYFFPNLYIKYAPFINNYGFIILLVVVFGTNLIGYLIGYTVFAFSWIFNLNINMLAWGFV